MEEGKKIELAFTADQLHIVFQAGVKAIDENESYAEWVNTVGDFLVAEAERLKIPPQATLALMLTLIETLLHMMQMSLFREATDKPRIFVPGGRI